MNRSRAITRLAAAGLVLALGGCGDTPEVDTSAVERYLVTSQAAAYDGLEVGAAECPSQGEPRDGMRFTCTLAVADAEVPYRVSLHDVDAEEVGIDVELGAVVVRTADVQTYVRSLLQDEDDFASTTVSCDGEVLVTEVGETLECELGNGPEVRPLKVTVEDDDGHVSVA